MIDPEPSIDTVLTGLRQTEPSPGFERRLLETLAAHPAATPHPSRHWPLRPSLARVPLPLGAAARFSLAAVLLLTLSLAVFRRHISQPPLTAKPARQHLSLRDQPSAASARDADPPQLASRRTVSHPDPGPRVITSHRPAQVASFPAPPMPLTPQEKLLLQVARARNPQQSPVLNPALRAGLAARDNEDFQIFFAPATTIKQDESSN